MKFSIACLITCFVVLAAWNTFADEIIWPKPAFPPYAFFSEDKKLNGKGCDQLMIQYLIPRLPQDWTHTFTEANYKRIVEMICDGSPTIIMGLFKTRERMDNGVLYNEIPMTLTLSNEVVILKKNFDRFKPYMVDGELDFEKVVLSQDLVVGVNRGRSYSGVFDEVITKHKEKLFIRSGSDFIGMFRMLEKDRIQAFPEFPITIGYMITKSEVSEDQVMLINAHGMAKNTFAYIAAPNNAWGREKLRVIDEVMKQPETIKTFARLYAGWLPDEKTKRFYFDLIEDYFIKNHGITVTFE